MGNMSRVLLRAAALFLTLAIICMISAAAMAGGASAHDDPDDLTVPGISPVPAGEGSEGASSNPPISRNAAKPVSSTAPPSVAPQPTPPPAATPPPVSSVPPVSSIPPVSSTAPVTQAASSTSTTVPAAMPATGAGFAATQGLGVRAVLQGVALVSILLAVGCASSGLAFARQRLVAPRD